MEQLLSQANGFVVLMEQDTVTLFDYLRVEEGLALFKL